MTEEEDIDALETDESKLVAKYRCRGYARGTCDHESDKPWVGFCPSCGRPYDCEKIKGASKHKKPLTSLFKPKQYLSTGIPEVDRVMGGGFVRSCSFVIAGEPGGGKTTIYLQVCGHLFRKDKRILFASGEQTREEIAQMAHRFGTFDGLNLEDSVVQKGIEENFVILGMENDVYAIVERIKEVKPCFAVVDSLQVVGAGDVEAQCGSTDQVKAVANILTDCGKETKVPIAMVSQVTKGLDIAGSMQALHACDGIFYISKRPSDDKNDERNEKPKNWPWRTLECHGKNRNGSVDETATFEMTSKGLVPVRPKGKLTLVE